MLGSPETFAYGEPRLTNLWFVKHMFDSRGLYHPWLLPGTERHIVPFLPVASAQCSAEFSDITAPCTRIEAVILEYSIIDFGEGIKCNLNTVSYTFF